MLIDLEYTSIEILLNLTYDYWILRRNDVRVCVSFVCWYIKESQRGYSSEITKGSQFYVRIHCSLFLCIMTVSSYSSHDFLVICESKEGMRLIACVHLFFPEFIRNGYFPRQSVIHNSSKFLSQHAILTELQQWALFVVESYFIVSLFMRYTYMSSCNNLNWFPIFIWYVYSRGDETNVDLFFSIVRDIKANSEGIAINKIYSQWNVW